MKKMLVLFLVTLLWPPVALAQKAAQPERWRFTNGAEFPGSAGNFSVDADGVGQLHFDFSAGGSYVGAVNDLPAPLPLMGVSFQVRKPAEAHLTARIIDSTDQTLQEPLYFDHDDWQSARMDMGGFDGHFGGANDGVVHPPIKAFAILVESKHLDSKAGTVEIKDVIFHLPAKDAPSGPQSSIYLGEYIVTDFDPAAGMYTHAPHTLNKGLWKVDFSATESASINRSISLLGNPRDLILTVEGGAPGMQLEVRMASHFQGFSRTIDLLHGGRQTFAFPVPPEGWKYSGGENDGKARLPLRLSSFKLKRGSAAKGVYDLRLEPLRCRTAVSKTVPVVLQSTLKVADELRLDTTCSARNLLARPVAGTLNMQARDWDGALLTESAQPWTLPAKGAPVSMELPVPLAQDQNFVEVAFRFTAAGLQRAETRATYTRPLAVAESTTLKPESPWGMGIYLYRYPQGELMERAASMAAEAGVKWSREEFSWGRIETAPGVYNFDFYDSVVATAHQHGISVYGLLSYWGRFTEPYTQKGIDDFCAWARAVVRRYKDRIKHWEIYNEPNIFFWLGPKELYPVLLKQCYAAIKEEDPEAKVLGISTAGIDMNFIQFCLDADAPLDILTIHPYRGYFSEKSFMRELRAAAAIVDDKPVWITEMGWSTQVGASHERRQAQLLARCYISAVASGACQNISWYDFRNDGDDPFYNEANFGVIRRDFTPKPAYRALATVCHSFDRGVPQPLELPGGLHGVRLGEVAAIWSFATPMRLLVVLAEKTTLRNLMGETIRAETTNGQQAILLRPGAPVFIRGTYTIIGGPLRLEGTVERHEILF